jgi:type IV pilus assembly protein PilB
MVGEIRDEETADIAVNAALTGHLVLSSLHTNDAATTLPRLIDMNVEPFLVASTVNVIVAQRLVRKICRNCLMSTKLEKNQIQLLKQNKAIMEIFKKNKKKVENLQVYVGKGCSVCGQTGYQGRIGLFEVLEISDSIRSLIIAKASADQVRTVAVKENNMTTLLDDGLKKVFNGMTTIEEVLRVVID